MPLSLEYHADSAVPVELDGVTPERLAGKSASEIERLEIAHGNRRVPLAEFFRVSGDPTDGCIDLVGNLGGVHQIGRGMGAGAIRVRGDAGRHLGAGMTGGTIEVEGRAGDWVGGEMKGGVIRVAGSAGDCVGSAYAGSRRGMTEGTILIGGSAGDGCGTSMRRGLLAIGGTCGDDIGTGMIAGTILILGRCGERPGADMRRGTIGLFGPGPHSLLPTFRRAGRFRPLFLRLIARELERLGFAIPQGLSGAELTLYHGDLLSLGKGEVWLRDDGGSQ